MTIMSIAPAKPIIEVMKDGFLVFLRLVKRAVMNVLARRSIMRVRRKISRRLAPMKSRIVILSWALTIKLVGHLAPGAARGYPTPPELTRTYGQFHVVGLRHYNGIAKTGEHVSLVREPDNEYDLNAIAVHNQHGKQVGFISRDEAKALAPIMDRDTRVYGVVLSRVNHYRILIEVLEE